MEGPRLGDESELQLPVYTTVTEMQDPSCVCNLHRSSRQHWILNPLSEAKARTCMLMDPSRVLNPLSHDGNSSSAFVDWDLRTPDFRDPGRGTAHSAPPRCWRGSSPLSPLLGLPGRHQRRFRSVGHMDSCLPHISLTRVCRKPARGQPRASRKTPLPSRPVLHPSASGGSRNGDKTSFLPWA